MRLFAKWMTGNCDDWGFDELRRQIYMSGKDECQSGLITTGDLVID